jgi:dipeptidyl-peptidase-4
MCVKGKFMTKLTLPVNLNPADVAKHPRPGMSVPASLNFSFDDKWIAYLFSPDNSLVRHLYLYDLETFTSQAIMMPDIDVKTEESLSMAEKLRRERLRTRALGVTSYNWVPGSHRIMIPLKGNLYLLDDFSKSPRLLVYGEGQPLLDPQCSPDGASIAFVCDFEINIVNVDSGDVRQLTTGARGKGRSHGLAEYIAQEEMGRNHGFWWSRDSKLIAYTEVDVSHIPLYRIVHQGKAVTGSQAQEDHHYPFAGQSNAKVRLGVIDAAGGSTVWMDVPTNSDTYIARVQWWNDGTLAVQIQNRTQTRLHLYQCNPTSGRCQLLLEEKNPVWVNLHSMLMPLSDGRFVWASERTGFMHLYLFDQLGNMIRSLTSGPWMVDSLISVDEERELVYFLSTRDSALERHLYSISLNGQQLQRLTEVPGYHDIIFDHAKKLFIDTFSTSDLLPQVTLHSAENKSELCKIFIPSLSNDNSASLRIPEYIEIPTTDGNLLHGMIYRPPLTYGPGPFPTIVCVYGGPHVQQVIRSWSATVDMRAQYLSSLGYLLCKVDNRGSARRGQAFEGAVKYNMGDIEVQDQVAGIQWLIGQGLTDPGRVGVYGWSYGGYMALMCLSRAPDIFKAAVAGAPVTHWDGYDTHYTERYMGTPDKNTDGYYNSSVMTYVKAIKGKLLLVHGLIDENVHFRHTARLINALIRAGKTFELSLFPDERHMPRRLEDRIYLETQIRDFFLKYL